MEIKNQIELQKTSLDVNSNKWWRAILYEDNSTKIEYGRVGDSCVRPFFNKSWDELQRRAKSKIKEGYNEIKLNEIKVQVEDTGLPQKVVKRINNIFKETKDYLNLTSTLDTSNLSIDQLDAGKAALRQLSVNRDLETLSKYFNLVPTILPRKIDKHYELSRILSNLQSEQDRIDALISNVNSVVILQKGGNLFNQLGANLTENLDIDKYQDWINKTSRHGYKYQVKEVWDVNSFNEKEKKSDIDNIKELFHATKRPFVKSILTTGLNCPKYASNGRMYGNGVYFADTCSKSLNYTEGSGDCYLFIAEVKLGNIYKTKGCQDWNDVPKGYNSLFAEAGQMAGAWGNNLRFNEYVIYKENQQRLKNLLIISKI